MFVYYSIEMEAMAKTKNMTELTNVWMELVNKYKHDVNKTENTMKLYIKQKNYLTKGTKQLTNTTNINQLTRVSSELLNKYKNNLSKTVKIMNTYKKHKIYLNKGEVTFEVFKFSPDNTNTLTSAGTLTTKRRQSIANYVRNKTTTKNEQTYGEMLINVKIVAMKPFTMLGQNVKGLVPIELGDTLKETHENAKFILRRLKFHDDITPKFIVISEKHGGGVFF
jgi:hypothetical protein|tara:strand:+ start:127 stop:795 length:669 start_codon:yes stop_codon:yes gene_type:complete